jgi:glycerol-3-phosphate O-acyltransferase
MSGEITLPFWIFAILLLTFGLVFFQYVIYPLVASFISARARMVTEELNPMLQLEMSQFTLTRRHVLADRLASDPEVEARLEEFARHKGLTKEQIRREAWRYAWDIVPSFNPYFYFRLGYRMARAGIRALYKMRVAFEDEASMADVKSDNAVVFIINHRSNIDYPMANYLTSKRTMLSFGVGEWSRVWPLQPLFRMAGGYFVRRGEEDPLYRLLLKRYVQMATEARVPHAIFIEGQLCNDGSVNPARVGILSYITEHFDPEKTPDLQFIPIGLNYDQVVEDVNTVRFSSAEFQAKGRIYVLRKGVAFMMRVMVELILRRQRFGLHCSNFGRPISFTEWLDARGVSWPDLDREARFAHIQALGDELTGRIRALVPATPMSVLCRSWFEHPEASLSRSEAEAQFRDTAARLRDAGCYVALFNDSLSESFQKALAHALDRAMLVQGRDGLLFAPARKRALVNYYGNSVSQFLEDIPET